MKDAKKILALLLALFMLSSVAMADETTTTATSDTSVSEATSEPSTIPESTTMTETGKITIDNAVVGQTYTIYQILYLESYNKDSGAYAYKANDQWKNWLKTQSTYVTVDDQDYVTWVKDADAVTFAKAAKAYAIENKLTAQGTAAAESKTVTFSNLALGYYLVDSTLGTLCSLDTTNSDVIIKEKNGVPTNEKEVKEDSTKAFGKTNDADIGDTVEFRSTIIAQAGAENYVFHDIMSTGLTYDSVTGITLNGETVDATNYTVKSTDLTDDCTFEIEFTQTFCVTLKADDKIVISYTATVNENAVIGLDGNKNHSYLSYGDENNTKSTPTSETITYTWDLDILKYANNDEGKVLKDAQFVLLNSDKTKVAMIVNGLLTGWTDLPATDGDDGTIIWPANTVLTTNDNGKIEIDGLDADTYYLREIKAPNGYNKLASDVEVGITGGTTQGEGENSTLTYTTVVTKVNNQSGTELPSTGGIGTTIFYIVGAVLAVGAAVLLVTKKRVSKSKN